ncbi:helix-turn-helix transcriptional regulator, partial [Klebsiella pneumoniae]
HEQIWTAIDRLAERYGFSASGLARHAGLDATSFNRSKRVGADGRKRWPSTESVSKVLAATGAQLDDFLRLIEPGERVRRATVPLVGMTRA